jgi:hypothetical protein
MAKYRHCGMDAAYASCPAQRKTSCGDVGEEHWSEPQAVEYARERCQKNRPLGTAIKNTLASSVFFWSLVLSALLVI